MPEIRAESSPEFIQPFRQELGITLFHYKCLNYPNPNPLPMKSKCFLSIFPGVKHMLHMHYKTCTQFVQF